MAHDALGAYALSAGIVLILENRNGALLGIVLGPVLFAIAASILDGLSDSKSVILATIRSPSRNSRNMAKIVKTNETTMLVTLALIRVLPHSRR